MSDQTSQGGRAIVWHLRQGLDNGEISRDALAAWIDDIGDQHDKLVAERDELLMSLREVLDLICVGLPALPGVIARARAALAEEGSLP